MKNYNNSWYSVILAILIVWFMLVLTSWVFSLVMLENKDTKAMEYYLKAFAWAEWSLELAMLKAKQFNYSFSDKIDNTDSKSKVLSRDISNFSKTKDVLITYNLDATTSEVKDKNLKSWEFDIIPLFYYDVNWDYKKVKNIIINWLNSDVVWNIVGENSWITWINNFTNNTEWNFKTINSWNINFSTKTIWDFISESEKNYLIIHNVSTNEINYTLKSLNPWEFITKEASFIIWSWEIWWYKQNLRVKIDNSKYLNLLKYSIFSN